MAVGGNRIINTIAQAAHGAGCVMCVICEGTFDYFASEDRAATEAAYALRWLHGGRP